MEDPRHIPPREPGESKRAYARRLNKIGIPCLCNCGKSVKVGHDKIANVPKYRKQCYLRLPGQRQRTSRTLTRLWKDPEYRKTQQERASHILDDPKNRLKRLRAIEKYWADPVNRKKKFKFTVSMELMKRYPDQVEWIEAHAQELDLDPDILPDSYLDGERLNELHIQYPDRLGCRDINGQRVKDLEECLI